MIAPKTSVAHRPHRILLQNPGPAISNGDGGFTQDWVDCDPPRLFVSIDPATARDLERLAVATVLSTGMYVVKGPYHPQVSPLTRFIFKGRVFHITGGGSPDERHVEMELAAVEQLGAPLVGDFAWTQPGWVSVEPAWVQTGTL